MKFGFFGKALLLAGVLSFGAVRAEGGEVDELRKKIFELSNNMAHERLALKALVAQYQATHSGLRANENAEAAEELGTGILSERIGGLERFWIETSKFEAFARKSFDEGLARESLVQQLARLNEDRDFFKKSLNGIVQCEKRSLGYVKGCVAEERAATIFFMRKIHDIDLEIAQINRLLAS